MKRTAASVGCFLLSGCAGLLGPADGYFFAVGATPGSSSCQLSVTSLGSKSAPQERIVSGSFRESFAVAPSPKGHRIALSCNNKVVESHTFKYGHDVRAGGDFAVNASAL